VPKYRSSDGSGNAVGGRDISNIAACRLRGHWHPDPAHVVQSVVDQFSGTVIGKRGHVKMYS
jgi:hypothetical protein